MILGGCSYTLLLGTVVFLQNVLSYEKPAWATTGFDLPSQEREQLLEREPSNVYNIFCLDISERTLEKLFISGAVLLVTVIAISILYISLKHMKSVKPSQAMTKTPAALEAKSEWIQDHTKMLEQLVKSTHKINKDIKYVLRHEMKVLKSE